VEENKVMRVFLDSNVIFSSLYSSQGPPGLIVQRHVEGRLTAIISRQVLHEVVRTVTERLPRALPALKTFLESAPPEICGDARPAEAAKWMEFLHAEDAAILAAAVGARPDYLITGDRHFLGDPAIARKARLFIVTPARFIDASG
jgi:putative PIN family toxin of toxin-antitoxin system